MSNRLTAKPAASSPSAGDVLYLDGPAGVRKLDAGYLASAATTAAAAAVAGHDASPTAHLNIQRRTLTGNLVLTTADLPLQRIIPDADREVTLPAEGATQWRFEICHGGPAHTVTVKRAGGTTVASLITGAPVVVAWDGVAFGIC